MAAYGNMDKGLPGGLIGLTETHQIDSRLAKGNIPYGAPVFGTGDGEQVTRTGSALLGVAGRTAKDTQEWKDGDSVNVVRTGKVWGVAGSALSADAEISVNASTGKFVEKTSAADGAARVVTITVADNSATSKVVTVLVGDKGVSLTTSDDVKSNTAVASALQALLAAIDIPFTATVSSGVVTLTAKDKGVAFNSVAIVATTTDTTQTLTVAQTTAGSDQILNPGWFVRSTADAQGDLVAVDLG